MKTRLYTAAFLSMLPGSGCGGHGSIYDLKTTVRQDGRVQAVSAEQEVPTRSAVLYDQDGEEILGNAVQMEFHGSGAAPQGVCCINCYLDEQGNLACECCDTDRCRECRGGGTT